MRSKKLLTLAAIVLAIMVIALPLANACGPKAKPGEVLKVGMITPSTGPAAEKGAPMGDANLDAIQYINTELGGAAGYPIQVEWFDSGYNAANVVTQVKKLMDDGCLMFNTSSSFEMTAAKESANRAGFAGLACFSAPSLYRPPQHIYGQTPDYGDDALAFTNYFLKNIWKGTGKPKFAVEMLNNSTGYGARDAFKAKADEMGIQILEYDEHTATTTSEMDALTRIKALKPDVLYISSTPAPTAIIVKNASDLGMYPGITIGCGHASFTSVLIANAGAKAEGVYGAFPMVMWGDNVPGMAKMTEYVRKLHPKDEGNADYITAWSQSLIVAEILRLAVNNAGYDVLAKGDATAWQALETQGIQKLSNYDVGGLQGPVSYTPGDNRLTKFNRIYQIVNGKITNPSPWVEAPLVKYETYDWWK